MYFKGWILVEFASPCHICLIHDDLMILSLTYFQVKLTIMIEDPRDIERRRLLGIEDPDGPTREDLVAALEEVSFFFYNHDCLDCALMCKSIDTLTYTKSFRICLKFCLGRTLGHSFRVHVFGLRRRI